MPKAGNAAAVPQGLPQVVPMSSWAIHQRLWLRLWLLLVTTSRLIISVILSFRTLQDHFSICRAIAHENTSSPRNRSGMAGEMPRFPCTPHRRSQLWSGNGLWSGLFQVVSIRSRSATQCHRTP